MTYDMALQCCAACFQRAVDSCLNALLDIETSMVFLKIRYKDGVYYCLDLWIHIFPFRTAEQSKGRVKPWGVHACMLSVTHLANETVATSYIILVESHDYTIENTLI